MCRALAILLAATLAVSGCGSAPHPQYEPVPPAGVLNMVPATIEVWKRLVVAPGGPMDGYDRKRFGRPWYDTDHNGCDQRSDVLARDAARTTRDPKRHCQITAIELLDPYTGERLTRTIDIQIDHVVPLGMAWRSGAAAWTADQREHYATDESNLLAVKGAANEAKGDKPPDVWKPRREAWCLYAKVYITTSDSYRLTVTAATKAALGTMLDTCGG